MALEKNLLMLLTYPQWFFAVSAGVLLFLSLICFMLYVPFCCMCSKRKRKLIRGSMRGLVNSYASKPTAMDKLKLGCIRFWTGLFVFLSAFCFGMAILIAVSFDYLAWWIGAPVVFTFWILVLLHSTRAEDAFMLVSKDNTTTMGSKYERIDFDSDYDRSCCASLAFSMRHYPAAVAYGIKNNIAMISVVTMFALAMSLGFALGTCGTCVAFHPFEITTTFSRMVQPSDCPLDNVCHTYLTVPEDMSTSMIVNFHARISASNTANDSTPAARGAVVIYRAFDPVIDVSPDLDPQDAILTIANASMALGNSFHVDLISDETRYQFWVDLVNLTASTSYFFKTGYYTANGKLVLSTKQFKFRTAPATTTPATSSGITFVSGGDTEWNEAGLAMLKFAATKDPLFAIVGGDLAYENAMATCYRRWDTWLKTWQNNMVTPTHYSVPILSVIGNHEAGGWSVSRSDSPFYIRYFPHRILTGNDDPQQRQLFHYHRFGKDVSVIGLDSGVITPIEGDQTAWLQQTLMRTTYGAEGSDNEVTEHKYVVYHASIYPSVVQNDMDFITEQLRQYWRPLFDNFRVKVALENHYHRYKVSHPLFNNTVVEEGHGTRYLGDGAWGVSPNPLFKTPDTLWYAQKVGVNKNIYVIRVGDNTGIQPKCTNFVQSFDDKANQLDRLCVP